MLSSEAASPVTELNQASRAHHAASPKQHKAEHATTSPLPGARLKRAAIVPPQEGGLDWMLVAPALGALASAGIVAARRRPKPEAVPVDGRRRPMPWLSPHLSPRLHRPWPLAGVPMSLATLLRGTAVTHRSDAELPEPGSPLEADVGGEGAASGPALEADAQRYSPRPVRRSSNLLTKARAADLVELATTLEHTGDLGGAEEAYRRADELGYPVAAFKLGALLAERGDLAGAEAVYRRADERGHADAASNLGVLLEEQGTSRRLRRRTGARTSGVMPALRSISGVGWPSGGTWPARRTHTIAPTARGRGCSSNLGTLLEPRGDVDGAEAAYRRADKRGHAGAAFNVGVLLAGRGDFAGAEAAYTRAEERGHDEVSRLGHAALLELRGSR